MPLVIDQIDTEIAPEARAEPKSGETAAVPDPAEFAERLRQELMTIEARRKRLCVD